MREDATEKEGEEIRCGTQALSVWPAGFFWKGTCYAFLFYNYNYKRGGTNLNKNRMQWSPSPQSILNKLCPKEDDDGAGSCSHAVSSLHGGANLQLWIARWAVFTVTVSHWAYAVISRTDSWQFLTQHHLKACRSQASNVFIYLVWPWPLLTETSPDSHNVLMILCKVN